MAQSVESINKPPEVSKNNIDPLERNPNSPGSDSSQCDSPDGKCAICLGKLENKSFTDSCFHTFCFTCLQEWSKVRPECPLCKQRFSSIIHNVRSNNQYDKYDLAPQQTDEPMWYGYAATRRFRYHTTLTAERRQRIAWLQRLSSSTVSPYNTNVHWRYYRQTATSDFRRLVYDNNMWVQTTSGRYRDTAPTFYRNNPACLHRLVPWLNRELNVLLYNYESHVSFVLELILSLLPRFDIRSEEFHEHISPFISLRTAHFIHEFYHFARSLYDMVAYDRFANYSSNQEVIELSPECPRVQSESDAQNVKTITISSSSSSSDSDVNDYLNKVEMNTSFLISKVKKFLSDEASRWDWDKSPGRSNSQTSQNTWDTPVTDTGGATSSDPHQPGPSGFQSNKKRKMLNWDSDSSNETPLKQTKVEEYDSSSSSDFCMVVDALKPKRERTPDIITIDSGSDDDKMTFSAKCELLDKSTNPSDHLDKSRRNNEKKKKHRHKKNRRKQSKGISKSRSPPLDL